MRSRRLVGVVLAAALAGLARPAAPRPEDLPVAGEPEPGATRLTLAEASRMAVAANLRLRASRMDSPIAEQRWRAEIASFDTLLTAQVEVAHDETPTTSGFFGQPVLEEDSVRAQAGLVKKLHSGGEVSFLYRADRLSTNSAFTTLNPAWTQGAVVEARQPILRGAGDVSLAEVGRARNDMRAADQGVRAVEEDVLLETAATYWALAFAQAEVVARRKALDVAGELWDDSKARLEAEVGTVLDVADARAGAEARRGDLIQAENVRGDASDRLRALILPFTRSEPGGAPFYAVDDPRRDRGTTPDPTRVDAYVLAAMQGRPELLASLAGLSNRDIDVWAARDLVRPQLDVVARTGTGGLDDGFGGSLGNTVSGDAVSGAIGIEFSMFLGQRAAKARWHLADWARRQAVLRHRELENQVGLQVRLALREIESARARRESARAEVQAATEGLAGERDRLQHAQSTPFRVLEKESLLTDARTRENRATADLRIAEARFWRAIGRLAEHLGVAGAPGDATTVPLPAPAAVPPR